ncbi:MAG: DUF3098 domain-containing protein [Chitinophagaceae bacterium]|jgi:hypothetical protein|nr:DUF3098 domain-containing protein [Chitinophagaceae bacterium]
MAEKKQPKTVVTKPKEVHTTAMFGKENYIWMLAGIIIIAIGFILMAGGKSPDPNVFNEDEVYSTTRITIAPLLIMAGLVVEIIALFRKPKD